MFAGGKGFWMEGGNKQTEVDGLQQIDTWIVETERRCKSISLDRFLVFYW
jgi:hypothetical protein